MAVNGELGLQENSLRGEGSVLLHFAVDVYAIQAFCLNLGSIFKSDKITLGKTNGLIRGE